ncbi:MAG: hypothetical protein ACKOCT_15435, partial [Alphaproteobacteria bacterium]
MIGHGPPVSSSTRPSRRETLASAVAYTLLFAFLARDWIGVAAHSSPLGNPAVDASYVTWILWWGAKALTTDPSRLYDAPMFHPTPRMLTASEHFLSSQLVFAPVWALTDNPVLAANVVSLVSYPLAGFAMDRLLRAMGLGVAASWTGGLAFALGPPRLPGSNHMPQMLGFFLPAIVLALIRAREEPGPRRFACFALLLLLALFSSYYLAVMVVLVVTTWTLLDVLREPRGATRFVATVAGIGLACSALLALFSIPWMSGQPAAPFAGGLPGSLLPPFLWQPRDDWVEPLLGLAGSAALLSPRRRFPATAGLAIALLATGFIAAVALFGLPDFILPVLGFFRFFPRMQLVTSFGVAILAGCAVQMAADRRGQPAAALVAATACLALSWTLGPRMSHPSEHDVVWGQPEGPWNRQHPGRADAIAYRRIGELARREGGGAMVEVGLPPWNAMVDATWHEMPLVDGYTTLWPPQYFGVLPRKGSASGLDELVDISHLRWVIFPPSRRWTEPIDRERLLRELLAMPMTTRFDVGDFVLVRLDRPPAHPAWFETLAAGRPLGDLPPEEAEAISRLGALEGLGRTQALGTTAP